MKEFFKKRKKIIWAVIIVLLILAAVFIWLKFFYFEKCLDKMCFYSSLSKCERASFISDGNITLRYKISGKSGDNCIVNIELLDAGLSNKDLRKVKNLDMKCFLPYGVLIIPESDLALCHGNLKESFQDLIINKLHTYIVKNLGEINADLLKA
jgi:hypothetical protein